MTFCHILRGTFILQGNVKSRRGNRDKRALVIQTHCVSFIQDATAKSAVNSLSRWLVRGNDPEPKKFFRGGKKLNGVFLTGHINIRVTPKERNEIQEQAEISGLSISEYIRRRVCGRRIPSRIEKRMLSELRRQGGLLKYIFNESQGMYSEKTAKALDNINSFISGLERVILNDNENSHTS